MSKPADRTVHLTDTLSLSEYQSPKNGNFGFWLWDRTREMNLAIRAKSEQEAFVNALTYYQKRLKEVEDELHKLTEKVNAFVEQVAEDADED